ncbi:NUDIX domain-containing protein [Halegenticoccus tardaugens]|uniref:NUDIX domain-containing protein n=1 Tax=Halegenticoccus tardaugens TaxID=2071624 RepID=UPI00100AC71F|nr:NUDIX domain-containing protein [Halegenticoccus tardaugens]
MKVHDERIPTERFERFLNSMPQVSVELVISFDRGILLLRRRNEPAKGEWFWPGTRLYKGEAFDQAAKRLAREELGIEVQLRGMLGVYNHFWNTGDLPNVETTHTVNVVYRAHSKSDAEDITLDSQHDDYRFITEIDSALHKYVIRYLDEGDFF